MADAAEDLDLEIPTGELDELGAEAPPEAPEGEEDELQVSFEGEGDAPPQNEERDSSVIRELRARNREQARELEAFRRQQQPQKVEVGEKPSLESCEYDPDKFETEYEAWTQRKAEAERQNAEAQRSQAAQQEAWNRRLADLEAQKAQLGARDYDQAAEEVRSTFDEQQQAMIVRAAKNPAKLIYALGKNPAKAAELAKISDPVELIAELARVEGKIAMTTQRKAPPPEETVRGSAPLSQGADKHLERLEAEAARTGDRTKVVAYKRQLKAKATS